jgi:hypothetical protein
VSIRVFLPTPVCNLHLVGAQYDTLPAALLGAYETRLRERPPVSEAIRAAVEEMANPEEKPWYVSETQERERRRGNRKAQMRSALENAEVDLLSPVLSERGSGPLSLSNRHADDDTRIRRIHKRPHAPITAPRLTKREFRIYLRWAYAKKTALEDFYRARAGEVPFDRPYVLLALHLQPERTTCPDGGRYSNQLMVAAQLARALPEGWSLYIKEHQSQFLYNNNGEQGRTFEFYRFLEALPNTHLVSLEQPTAKLVQNARAVATITGMIGWEALLRGVPPIVFGAAWYRGCRGVHPCERAQDVEHALAAIADGVRPDKEDAVQYAGALEDVGYVCYTNTSMAHVVDTDHEQQVATLVRALIDQENGRR